MYRRKKLVYFNCKQEVRHHKNTIKSTVWGSLSAFPQQRPDCLCWKPALMWYSCTSLDHMAVKSWWVRKSCEKPPWRPPCFTCKQCLGSICCCQQQYMVCPSQTLGLTWNLPYDCCGSPASCWLTLALPGNSSTHLAPAQVSVGSLLQLAQLVAFLPLQQPAPAAVLAAVIPVPFIGFDMNLLENSFVWYHDPWIKITLSNPKNKEHCFILKTQATKLVTKLIIF